MTILRALLETMGKPEEEILAEAHSLAYLKKGLFYRIPRYQRNYSWTEDQVLTLLFDTLKYFRTSFENNGDKESTARKFIGALILIKVRDDNKPETIYNVIDGQQRLTTLQITCFAVALRLIGLVRTFIKEFSKIDPELRKIVSKPALNAAMNTTLNLAKTEAAQLIYRSQDNSYQPYLYREDSDRELTTETLHKLDEQDDTAYCSETARAFKYLARFFSTADSIQNEGKSKCDWANGVFCINELPDHKWSGQYSLAFNAADKFLEAVERGMSAPCGAKSDSSSSERKTISLIERRKEEEDISPEENFDVDVCLKWLSHVYNQRFDLDNVKAAFDVLGDNPEFEPCIDVLRRIMRLGLFQIFFAHNVSFVSITSSSNEALDIFRTINTAGKPLTCIETFLPEAYRFVEEIGLPAYITKTSVPGAVIWENNSLGSLLSKVNTLCALVEEAKVDVADVVTAFALVYDGTKLGKSVIDQRRYLSRALKRTIDTSEADEYKIFAQLYCLVLTLYLALRWRLYLECAKRRLEDPTSDGKDEAQDLLQRMEKELVGDNSKELDDSFLFVINVIRESNLTLPLTLLSRYFVKWQREKTEENAREIAAAARALLAFSAFWLSSSEKTKGIDAVFRTFMSGKPGESKAHSVVDCEDKDLDAKALQRYLFDQYRGRNPDSSLKGWQEGLKAASVAGDRPTLARFLLLVYMEYSELDTDPSPIGVRCSASRSRSPSQSRLRTEVWKELSQFELEHIVPQKADKAWSSIFKDCKTTDAKARLIQQLGNITFLPKVANIKAGNRPWKEKKVIYELLADNRGSVAANLRKHQSELSFDDKDLRRFEKHNDALREYARSEWTAGYEKLKSWDKKTIGLRTDAIAAIIWPHLLSWLGVETTEGDSANQETSVSNNDSAKVPVTPTASATLSLATSDGAAFDAEVLFRGAEAFVSRVLQKKANEKTAEKLTWRGRGDSHLQLFLESGKVVLFLTHKDGFRTKGCTAHKTKNSGYFWYFKTTEEFEGLEENLKGVILRWQKK